MSQGEGVVASDDAHYPPLDVECLGPAALQGEARPEMTVESRPGRRHVGERLRDVDSLTPSMCRLIGPVADRHRATHLSTPMSLADTHTTLLFGRSTQRAGGVGEAEAHIRPSGKGSGEAGIAPFLPPSMPTEKEKVRELMR